MTEHIPFYFMAPTPPSVAHAPWLFAASVFGLFGGSLLAVEWSHRLVWRLIEEPHPWRHPATQLRVILLLMCVATIMRIGPDAFNFMVWPEVSPATRFHLADANRLLDFFSIIPTAMAWMFAQFARPVIGYQLVREPVPVDMWPTWRQAARGLTIGVLVLLISLGVTLLR